jgi:hypothetical protein
MKVKGKTENKNRLVLIISSDKKVSIFIIDILKYDDVL